MKIPNLILFVVAVTMGTGTWTLGIDRHTQTNAMEIDKRDITERSVMEKDSYAVEKATERMGQRVKDNNFGSMKDKDVADTNTIVNDEIVEATVPPSSGVNKTGRNRANATTQRATLSAKKSKKLRMHPGDGGISQPEKTNESLSKYQNQPNNNTAELGSETTDTNGRVEEGAAIQMGSAQYQTYPSTISKPHAESKSFWWSQSSKPANFVDNSQRGDGYQEQKFYPTSHGFNSHQQKTHHNWHDFSHRKQKHPNGFNYQHQQHVVSNQFSNSNLQPQQHFNQYSYGFQQQQQNPFPNQFGNSFTQPQQFSYRHDNSYHHQPKITFNDKAQISDLPSMNNQLTPMHQNKHFTRTETSNSEFFDGTKQSRWNHFSSKMGSFGGNSQIGGYRDQHQFYPNNPVSDHSNQQHPNRYGYHNSYQQSNNYNEHLPDFQNHPGITTEPSKTLLPFHEATGPWGKELANMGSFGGISQSNVVRQEQQQQHNLNPIGYSGYQQQEFRNNKYDYSNQNPQYPKLNGFGLQKQHHFYNQFDSNSNSQPQQHSNPPYIYGSQQVILPSKDGQQNSDQSDKTKEQFPEYKNHHATATEPSKILEPPHEATKLWYNPNWMENSGGTFQSNVVRQEQQRHRPSPVGYQQQEVRNRYNHGNQNPQYPNLYGNSHLKQQPLVPNQFGNSQSQPQQYTNPYGLVLPQVELPSADNHQSSEESNEPNNQSNEASDQSNEVNDQSNETNDQSNETNDQSVETTGQSNDSNDQSNETNDQSVETNDQSVETTGQPNESNNQPIETDNQPIETNNQPIKTNNQPIKTNNQPIETNNQPIETNNQPIETNNQPIKTNNQPIKTKNQPIKTNNQPIKTNNQPIETNDQPIETNDQPIETNNQPIKTNNQPIKTKNQPIKTNNQHIETDNQPIKTNNRPVETNNQPVETNNQFTGTNNAYISTIDPSISTSTKSTETNHKSIETKNQNNEPNDQFIETNNQNNEPNDQFIETKNQLNQPSDQSIETNNQSIETNDQSIETDDQSVETNDQSVETSDQSTETKDSSNETNEYPKEYQQHLGTTNTNDTTLEHPVESSNTKSRKETFEYGHPDPNNSTQAQTETSSSEG